MKRILNLILILLVPLTLSAQLLYKIEGNGLTRPSYIFGTHHLAPISILDSIPGILEAFESSEAVVGEIDMTGSSTAMAMAMQPYMIAPKDSTLSSLYTPKQFEELNQKFENLDIMPGINLYAFDGVKPMVVINLVSLSIYKQTMPDYDPSAQLDQFFQQLAVTNEKGIIPLENPQHQAELLFSFLPVKVQAESLAELLENPDEMREGTLMMNQAYLRGNLEELLEKSFKDDSNPKFTEALVNTRNAAWVETLIKIMAEKPLFVAVGALHLPGENGLLKSLENLGFSVSPVIE